MNAAARSATRPGLAEHLEERRVPRHGVLALVAGRQVLVEHAAVRARRVGGDDERRALGARAVVLVSDPHDDELGGGARERRAREPGLPARVREPERGERGLEVLLLTRAAAADADVLLELADELGEARVRGRRRPGAPVERLREREHLRVRARRDEAAGGVGSAGGGDAARALRRRQRVRVGRGEDWAAIAGRAPRRRRARRGRAAAGLDPGDPAVGAVEHLVGDADLARAAAARSCRACRTGRRCTPTSRSRRSRRRRRSWPGRRRRSRRSSPRSGSRFGSSPRAARPTFVSTIRRMKSWKLAASPACLGSMEGESSTTNRMSALEVFGSWTRTEPGWSTQLPTGVNWYSLHASRGSRSAASAPRRRVMHRGRDRRRRGQHPRREGATRGAC